MTGQARSGGWALWEQLLRISLFLLAAGLPFAVRQLPLFVMLLALAVLALRLREGGTAWRRPALSGPMPWMVLYYLMHILGMAWSGNTAFGSFDLEVKASLLLFPLLFCAFPAGHSIPEREIWRSFTWANAVAVAACLSAAVWRFGHECYLRDHGVQPADPAWTNHFFESRFSLFLHPSYMAMYLCVALAALLFRRTGAPALPVLEWVLPAILGTGIILCNSKMGWLTLAVVSGLAMIEAWRDARRRGRLVALAGAGLVVFLALFAAFPTVSGKLTQAMGATGAIDPASDQSSALRRMAWDAAVDLFWEHPFSGVGTGDIKDELINAYRSKGYVHAEAKRMNAHSQFLQTAAALGFVALLVLLAMLVLPFVAAWRNRDAMALAFWSVIFLNWSVESMAEVQAGVLFLSYAAWLLGFAASGGQGTAPSRSMPPGP